MKIPHRASKSISYIKKYFKWLLQLSGFIMLIAVILSFTSYPYWAYYWLGVHNASQKEDPDIIIMLGGNGMPSPDGLIRTYYTAKTAHEFPFASIYIAMPNDTSLHEESPELMMANEIILRGIDSNRIHFEPNGINTHSQALNIARMLGKASLDTIIIRIITSPEQMYRAVASFKKAGFKNVGGIASFEEALPENLLIGKHKKELKTERLDLRYNIWNYLKYEIIVVREYCAIAYYKIRGWM